MTQRRTGRLCLIGGAEDREGSEVVLSKLAELAGGPAAKVVLLTAASQSQAQMCDTYRQAFAKLGLHHVTGLPMQRKQDAEDQDTANRTSQADLVFITGGDQRRLMDVIGGTRTERAIHQAFERGACIAGTSAGASAMSRQMIAAGPAEAPDCFDAVELSPGLGLLPQAVVDQHFSQRHRLGRLLCVVAANRELIGIGIDEDTALLIEPRRSLEVVGRGAVTLLDGRRMQVLDGAGERRSPGLADARLHLLPVGARYRALPGPDGTDDSTDDSAGAPPVLHDMIALLAPDGAPGNGT
jgi:cyanophycinase